MVHAAYLLSDLVCLFYFLFIFLFIFLSLFISFLSFRRVMSLGEPDKAIFRLRFFHRYGAPFQPNHIVFPVRKQRGKTFAKSQSGESHRQPWRPPTQEDVMHIPTRSPRTHGPGPNAPAICDICSFALLGKMQSGCSCVSAAPSSCIFLSTKHQRSRFFYFICRQPAVS